MPLIIALLQSCNCKDKYQYLDNNDKSLNVPGDTLYYLNESGDADTFICVNNAFHYNNKSSGCGYMFQQVQSTYFYPIPASADFNKKITIDQGVTDTGLGITIYLKGSELTGSSSDKLSGPVLLGNVTYDDCYKIVNPVQGGNITELLFSPKYGVLQFKLNTGEIRTIKN
ncbi:MAG: hypothetical protein NTW49_08480 [Bacteroidia bacterium]|nr:hypothetical protein [Bacteroidia bacterium]